MDKEKYAKGINMDRKPADILMLIIFIAFIVAMGFCTSYGHKHGQIDKLLAPLDGDNNFCGITKGYEKYDKLFITDFSFSELSDIFDSAVCVKTCPTKTTTKIDGKTTTKVTDINTSTIIGNLYNTVDFMNYCLPASTDDLPSSFKTGYKLALDSFKTSSIGSYFNDMYLASKAIYASILMGLVYSIGYIYLMSAFAECIAWVCIGLTQVGLIAGAITCYMMRQTSIDSRSGLSTTDQASSAKSNAQYEGYLLAGCILLGILACAFLTCVICGYKSLKIAIDVIDASADFLAGTKRLLFVPLLYFLLTVISFCLWVAAMAYVCSLNDISADPLIPQAKSLTWKDNVVYMALFMLFGILWITAWFEYTSTFIVMTSASTYYFNSNPEKDGDAEVMVGFKFAYLYHAGSIAFGALIIAIVRFIRIVFLYLAKKAEKASGGNMAVKIIVACGNCCLKCIEKICDYINKSAFAYMVISGDSFCMSAWNGFLLNVKHLLKFSFANYLAVVFTFLGKIAIVVVNCFSCYGIMKKITQPDVSSYLGPIIIVGLITFMTASVFLGLFDVSVIAILTCYAVDMDLNNGEAKFGP